MQDFPGNSSKVKTTPPTPREKIERVTSAETVRRKRSLGRRFKEAFIGGDAKSTGDFVFFEVLIPASRDMMFEMFERGFQHLIYGDSHKPRRGGTTSGYSNLGHVSYNRMGTSGGPTARAEPRSLSRRARARHDFDEVMIASRQEAEEVLDRMFDLLSRYGSVSVADLYELTGIQSAHTDMKWGWVELRGAKAIRMRNGGYLLDLPEPEPLG